MSQYSSNAAAANGALPTGAATSANQTLEITQLTNIAASTASIDTKASGQATAAKQDTGNTSLVSIDTKLTSQATAANQTTGNTSLSSIDTKLTSQATAAKQDAGNTSLASIDTKTPAKGTATMTGAQPVTIATDDTVMTGFSGKFAAAATPGAAGAIPSTTAVAAISRLVNAAGTGLDTQQSGLTTAQSSAVGFANGINFAQYLLTQPTMTNSQIAALQSDVNANLRVTLATQIAGEDLTNNILLVSNKPRADSVNIWSTYASATKVGTAGVNVKVGSGRLRLLKGTNASTTVSYWLLVVAKTTAPVANDLPVWSAEIPAATASGPSLSIRAIDFGPEGLFINTGISYAISTTPEKVTLAGSSDCMIFAEYL